MTLSYVSAGQKKNYTTTYKGLIPYLERTYQEGEAEKNREKVENYATWRDCPQCDGFRLNEQSLNTRIHKDHIGHLAQRNVDDSLAYFDELKLSKEQKKIAKKILKNCIDRLRFLKHVGLGYITLARRSNTLS